MRKTRKDVALHERPPNCLDGSTAVTAAQRSGVSPAAGAGGTSAQTSRSDAGGERSSNGSVEPDSPSWGRTFDSLGVFQSRSIFHLPRRLSSGYFSSDGGDSLPSSPLSPKPMTADKATQTPSPSGQVVQHAKWRMAGAHGGGLGMHGHATSPCSAWPHHAARDMQAEEVGRELQRIGDDFNRTLLARRDGGRQRQDAIHPHPLLPVHHEPAMLLTVVLLLLLISRIIYMQGSTNSPDHTQV